METNRRFTLDASVWRSDDGRTLIGGSDFTIVRLDGDQHEFLDGLVSGSALGLSDCDAFVRFLCDRNLIQPVPAQTVSTDVAVAIPCRDQQAELTNLLKRLDRGAFAEVVVVDDGSTPPLVVADDSVRVIRHEKPSGPGAARNTGWRSTTADAVLFLDADVITDGLWSSDAVSFLCDARVAAVAPRVRSAAGQGRPGRWEQIRPALDMGTVRSTVGPRRRVPYVPTAALLVRRDALEAVGGFDPSMLLGEDVDLVWRLHDRGWTVRYEPAFEVGHLPRTTVRAWMRQRVIYGRSNVVLASMHPAHVAGIELTWWNVAPLLLLTRSRLFKGVGVAAAAAGVLKLEDRLTDRSENPSKLAVRLQRDGIAYAAEAVAQGARRSYWPLALLASMVNRRARWCVAIAFTVPFWDRWQRRSGTPSWEWTAASVADDLSFGTGVWLESIRTRSLRSLRVHLSPIERFLPDDAPEISRRRSH